MAPHQAEAGAAAGGAAVDGDAVVVDFAAEDPWVKANGLGDWSSKLFLLALGDASDDGIAAALAECAEPSTREVASILLLSRSAVDPFGTTVLDEHDPRMLLPETEGERVASVAKEYMATGNQHRSAPVTVLTMDASQTQVRAAVARSQCVVLAFKESARCIVSRGLPPAPEVGDQFFPTNLGRHDPGQAHFTTDSWARWRKLANEARVAFSGKAATGEHAPVAAQGGHAQAAARGRHAPFGPMQAAAGGIRDDFDVDGVGSPRLPHRGADHEPAHCGVDIF